MTQKMKSSHMKFKKKSNKEIYDRINKNKKQEKAEREGYLEILSTQLKLPPDILAGAPIITMSGRNEICVENYKGILEYDNCCIKISTKIGTVGIFGKRLNISYFTNDEMKVTGIIHRVEYL